MKVPLLDLKRQYQTIRDDVRQAVDELLENQAFILGKPVADLEAYLAELAGSPHAVGVASGTDALLLPLRALDIGPGDEVITTPFTFFSTAGVVSNVGAKPVFVDIEEKSFNIDAAKIESAITANTKALIPVHLFGQAAEMDEILAIAGKHNLAVIEDAAQSLGGTYKGKPLGSLGTFGSTSFFPSKNLGGAGDGGMVFSADEELAKKVRWLRVHGSDPKYYHHLIGTNSRLDALQAAIVLQKAPHLAEWAKARRANAGRYETLLADVKEVTTPAQLPDREHVFNQYTIRAQNRDGLMDHLRNEGVGCNIYYPVPLHLQPCYHNLGYKEGALPIAETAAKEVLSLPVFPELREEEIQYTAERIKAFY